MDNAVKNPASSEKMAVGTSNRFTDGAIRWSVGNKKSHQEMVDILAEGGYSLDAVIAGGKSSTIWIGKFHPDRRKVPVPYRLAQLVSSLSPSVPTVATATPTRPAAPAAAEPTAASEHGSTSVAVAVKMSTDLTPASKRFLDREMRIWKELQHPNIVPVFEVFGSPQGCCITMEGSKCGDLLDHVQRNDYLAEGEAKRIMLPIISAVDFLHERDIAHRDLKCENIVLFEGGKVKLTDFGFARSCRHPTNGTKVLSETFCGSIPYVAPEVLEGTPYNPKYSDVWSLGVILYVVLYGFLPLPDDNVLELLHRAKEQDIFFPEHPYVSDRAIDMMLAMMEPDVLARPTVKDVQKSAWLHCEIEDYLASGPSNPSRIIQRKTNHVEGSSPPLSKEEVACLIWEGDTTGPREASKNVTRRVSAGDSLADWTSALDGVCECQHSSSASSCESAKQFT